VTALQQNADGSELEYLSLTVGPSGESNVSVASIREVQAVTAHSTDGDVRLTLWSIAANGTSITLKATKTLPELTAANAIMLTSQRVAVLGRTWSGNLSLTMHTWQAGQTAGSIEFVAGSAAAT
jgi:hypothetical protein